MTTNWRAMQVPMNKATKEVPIPHGVLPRYMTMGTFHADVRKEGRSRKVFPGSGSKNETAR